MPPLAPQRSPLRLAVAILSFIIGGVAALFSACITIAMLMLFSASALSRGRPASGFPAFPTWIWLIFAAVTFLYLAFALIYIMAGIKILQFSARWIIVLLVASAALLLLLAASAVSNIIQFSHTPNLPPTAFIGCALQFLMALTVFTHAALTLKLRTEPP